MTWKRERILAVFLILTWSVMIHGVHGQDNKPSIGESLTASGFENIRVKQNGDDLTVSFENNIYRWNVRAISTALDKVSTHGKTPTQTLAFNILRIRLYK
ncbi:MAG: hypothetical protein P8100_14335 [bacterium]